MSERVERVIKCVSVWQPWASLLFGPGEFRKLYETRPNAMGLEPGDELLIQSAKTQQGLDMLVCQISESDARHIITALQAQFGTEAKFGDLPRGRILGRVLVKGVHRVEDVKPSEQQRAFGDFRAGRVAIELAEPKLFETQPLYRGQQGVFYVKERELTLAGVAV